MSQRFFIHSDTIVNDLKNSISVFRKSLYNKKSFALFVLQTMVNRILNNRLKHQFDQWDM